MKEKDQKFKADIIGPNTQSGRFPAMSAVASAPNPVECWHSQYADHTDVPRHVIAALSRNLLSSVE